MGSCVSTSLDILTVMAEEVCRGLPPHRARGQARRLAQLAGLEVRPVTREPKWRRKGPRVLVWMAQD